EFPDAHQMHRCFASIQQGTGLTGVVVHRGKVIAKRTGGDQLLNHRIGLDEGWIRPGAGLLSHDGIKSRGTTDSIDEILLVHQVRPFASSAKGNGQDTILLELPDGLKESIPRRRWSQMVFRKEIFVVKKYHRLGTAVGYAIHLAIECHSSQNGRKVSI